MVVLRIVKSWRRCFKGGLLQNGIADKFCESTMEARKTNLEMSSSCRRNIHAQVCSSFFVDFPSWFGRFPTSLGSLFYVPIVVVGGFSCENNDREFCRKTMEEKKNREKKHKMRSGFIPADLEYVVIKCCATALLSR